MTSLLLKQSAVLLIHAQPIQIPWYTRRQVSHRRQRASREVPNKRRHPPRHSRHEGAGSSGQTIVRKGRISRQALDWSCESDPQDFRVVPTTQLTNRLWRQRMTNSGKTPSGRVMSPVCRLEQFGIAQTREACHPLRQTTWRRREEWAGFWLVGSAMTQSWAGSELDGTILKSSSCHLIQHQMYHGLLQAVGTFLPSLSSDK